MNGKVVFSIPFLLDQEVILLRHSLLMDQVPVFLPVEPTVGCKSFGRNIRLGFKQQQQDLIYNHLCLRK